jgi:putative membrane protein insertion efficiency factor
MSAVVGWLARVWKKTLGPALAAMTGGACRYQPTCSEYAAIAISKHGWIRGGALAIWRVLRCNPFTKGGFDPVPGTWPLPDEDKPIGKG